MSAESAGCNSSLNVQHIDRWDVNSLLEVSIDKRPWKKGKAGQ